MNKEFLTEQGIPEEKHEAILDKYNEGIEAFETAIKANVKIEGLEPEQNETKQDFLSRLVKADKADAVRGVYENFTPVIKSVTGIDKNEGEKETDYLKRAASSKIESVQSDFTKKIQEYELKLKKGVKDETLLEQIKEMQKVIDENETSLTNLKTEYENKYTRINKENELKTALPKIKEGVSSLIRDNAINTVISGIIDNNLEVSKNDKGELQINLGEQGKFKSILAKDYFTEKLEGIIEVSDGGGAGSGGQHQKDFLKMERADAKTKIRADLIKEGLMVGTDKYTNEFIKRFSQWSEANKG